MHKLIPMRAALENKDIFGKVFEGDSWDRWRVLLIAAMGEELTDPERAIFYQMTGREREPLAIVSEFWALMGRRSGKTRAIAVLGAYIAALCDFTDVLAPGERATLPILSATIYQAGKAMQYLSGIFDNVPALNKLVIPGGPSDTISLKTRVDIECRPASFRTIRSGTAVAIICDEIAFWRSDDAANPDTEILNAARPALATTGGVLAAITSPYAKKGEAYKTYKDNFGADGDPLVMVASAPSQVMNPSLPEAFVAREFKRDPSSAASEYGSVDGGITFRSDLEAFVSKEVVDSLVERGCFELSYDPRYRYVGFVDAAGGSGQDSMTMAIAHSEDGIAVLDVIREVKPPFSPDTVVEQFATLLKAYKLTTAKADKWGSAFVTESFSKHGVTCEQNADPKSTLYGELLPLLNSGKVRLLDHPRLVAQMVGLERRTARGGRDSIDHATGAHDDIANSVAGALVRLAGPMDAVTIWLRGAGKSIGGGWALAA
jgi:hypothetical protein